MPKNQRVWSGLEMELLNWSGPKSEWMGSNTVIQACAQFCLRMSWFSVKTRRQTCQQISSQKQTLYMLKRNCSPTTVKERLTEWLSHWMSSVGQMLCCHTATFSPSSLLPSWFCLTSRLRINFRSPTSVICSEHYLILPEASKQSADKLCEKSLHNF